MRRFSLKIFVMGCVLVSCSSNDDSSNSDDGLVGPSTYQFTRNGSTTVNYINQINGILMAEEFVSALIDNGNSKVELEGMFINSGDYFSSASLNQSFVNLRNSIASSQDYYGSNSALSNSLKVDFDGWITSQVEEVYPNWNSTASPGVSGRLLESDGLITRRYSAKGLQYNQAINKSLLGGFMIDQMLNDFLSTSVLDAGNNRIDNDNELLVSGSNYTAMEHKWDEAFGLVYGLDNAQSPQLNEDLFLNKYLYRVERDSDFEGIADDVYNAFKLGRAAIVAKDYTLRDQQAEIIRQKFSEIIAIRAVFYLRQGRSNLVTDQANAFHDLSEGYGFIYALQFTRRQGTASPYFTKTEVDGFLNQLMVGNGFWDVSEATLNQIAGAIASRFSFTIEQAEIQN